MKNNEFDRLMKQALEEKARGVEASPFLLQRIKRDVRQKQEKERFSMKGFHMKKLAVAAVICLASVTCYAAANLGGVEAHSSNDIKSFAKMEKAEKKVGFDAKYVESFSNGFTFCRGGTGETQGLDTEGNPFGKKYPTLDIGYRNEDGNWVVLLVEENSLYADTKMELTEGYSSQLYKFVPPDYKLTEEDKAREAKGELVLSYGSEEVKEEIMEGYSWQDEGLCYTLTAADCNLGEAAMVQMAAEIKG